MLKKLELSHKVHLTVPIVHKSRLIFAWWSSSSPIMKAFDPILICSLLAKLKFG